MSSETTQLQTIKLPGVKVPGEKEVASAFNREMDLIWAVKKYQSLEKVTKHLPWIAISLLIIGLTIGILASIPGIPISSAIGMAAWSLAGGSSLMLVLDPLRQRKIKKLVEEILNIVKQYSNENLIINAANDFFKRSYRSENEMKVLADIYFNREKWDEAFELYRAIGNAAIQIQAGKRFLKEERPQLAKDLFIDLHVASDDDYKIKRELLKETYEMLLKQGSKEDILSAFYIVNHFDGLDVDLFVLGQQLERHGMKETAVYCYSFVKEPTGIMARQREEEFDKGNYTFAFGRLCGRAVVVNRKDHRLEHALDLAYENGIGVAKDPALAMQCRQNARRLTEAAV